MYFRKCVVVHVVDQQTNSCHQPSNDIELGDSEKAIFHLVDEVIRGVSSVYVANVAKSVALLPLYGVVIGQERMKNKTKRKLILNLDSISNSCTLTCSARRKQLLVDLW